MFYLFILHTREISQAIWMVQMLSCNTRSPTFHGLPFRTLRQDQLQTCEMWSMFPGKEHQKHADCSSVKILSRQSIRKLWKSATKESKWKQRFCTIHTMWTVQQSINPWNGLSVLSTLSQSAFSYLWHQMTPVKPGRMIQNGHASPTRDTWTAIFLHKVPTHSR